VYAILQRAGQLSERSAVRAQRRPIESDVNQRLVWLAGEAVVAIPEVAAGWPSPAMVTPYYPIAPKATPKLGAREWVTLPDGTQAVVVRFQTRAPIARLVAALRERPWRSPGANAARVLFHLQRHGIAAPRMLAFGQRTISRFTGQSFLLAEPQPEAVPVAEQLTNPTLPVVARRQILRMCGERLRQLHDAGCRPARESSTNDPLFVVAGNVAVGSPFVVRLAKDITTHTRRKDIARVLTTCCGVTLMDRLCLIRGYLGETWRNRAERRKWTR